MTHCRTVSEVDYFEILPNVRHYAYLFEDEFDVEEPEVEEFDAISFDEALTQNSDDKHTSSDQRMQLNMAVGTHTRSRRTPHKFQDFITWIYYLKYFLVWNNAKYRLGHHSWKAIY